MVTSPAWRLTRVEERNRAALLTTVFAIAGMMMTAVAVLSGGWVQDAGTVVLIAGAAVVEGTLLSRSTANPIVALLAVPILAYALIIPATIGTMPGGGDDSIHHLIGRYLAASATGLSATDDWTFVVGLSWWMWFVSYHLGWYSMRPGRTGFAIVPPILILAVNALNAPHPADVVIPTAVAAGLLILALAQGHLWSLAESWERRHVQRVPGTVPRLSIITAAVISLAVVAVLGIPGLTNHDFTAAFFRGATGSTPGGLHGPVGPPPGDIGFSPSVRPGGDLRSNPRPVLTYKTDATRPVYLRVVTDPQFDRGNWSPTPPDQLIQLPVDPGVIPRDTTPADGGVGAAVALVRLDVTMSSVQGNGDEAFPGEPVAVDRSGLAEGIPAPSGDTQRTLITVDRVESAQALAAGDSVSTTGSVPVATESDLQRAGSAYPAFVLPFATLPADSEGNVQTLHTIADQWTAGATTPYDKAKHIESHLRDTSVFTYTLSPPKVNTSRWSIVSFLTTTHAGYCQYFASSMGALLRAEGIPTRLISGYGPGSVTSSGSGPVVHAVTTTDAHVWVEAYFPTYGWISFEPTPSSQYGQYAPIDRGTPAPVPSSTPSPGATPTAHPQPSPSPSATPATGAGAGGATSGGGGLAIAVLRAVIAAAVLGLALVALLVWVTRPRTLPATWRRIAVIARLLGVRRRMSSETIAAYAERICQRVSETGGIANQSRPPGSDPLGALRELASLTGKAEFGHDGLNGPDRARVVACWQAVLRACPRWVWNAMAPRRFVTRPSPSER